MQTARVAPNPLADTAGLALPRLSATTLVTLVLSGAFATVAFDLFGQALSPMAGFARLAPVQLAIQTWQQLFGTAYAPGGHLLHYTAGLLAYPFGWFFIARPVAARLTPALGWPLVAIVYGVALWVFALYFMAHLVAGNPAFLGFTGITWVALAGHVVYALAVAWAGDLIGRHWR